MSARIRSVDARSITRLPSDIDTIVAQLRDQREQSLADRQRAHRPPRLPSRKALAGIVEKLSAALFPNRLGGHDFSDEGIDYFVGQTLDTALRHLEEQVRRELQYVAGMESVHDVLHPQVVDITRTFAAQLPEVRALLDSDLRAAYEGDPAAGQAEQRLLEGLLEQLQEQGLLQAGGRQRTDSTHVLAAVRDLNRLERVGETLRAALNSVVVVAPD